MDIQIFDQVPLFATLSSTDRESLVRHFISRKHKKNTIIINEGDDTNSLYLILNGSVNIYLTDKNGKQVILNTQSAGEYFGEISLFDDGLRSASVITREDCEFAVLMKQDFVDCLADNPSIALEIIRGLTRRTRDLSENVRSLALMDVYGRVARLLLELAVEQDGKKIIEKKLTNNDIAAHVGASPKMVSRIMRDLKQGGYVLKSGKQLIIDRPLPPAW